MSIAEVLRAAVVADGRSLYLIARAAGLDRPGLVRFVRGGGLSLASAGRLADVLGLALTASHPARDVTTPPGVQPTPKPTMPEKAPSRPSEASVELEAPSVHPKPADRPTGLVGVRLPGVVQSLRRGSHPARDVN